MLAILLLPSIETEQMQVVIYFTKLLNVVCGMIMKGAMALRKEKFKSVRRIPVALQEQTIREMSNSCILHVKCKWQKEVALFQCVEKCGRGANFHHVSET